MKIGTSLRFLFPAGPQTTGIHQAIAAAAPPDAFTDRPMGSEDVAQQARNLIDVARAARASGLWGLLVGDNHAMPTQYANAFQPVPTIGRLSAETGPMMVGMALLAPFYHPLLLAEQVATLSAFVDAETIDTFIPEGLRLRDGSVVPADVVVLATGYQNLQEGVRRMLGYEIAERIGLV